MDLYRVAETAAPDTSKPVVILGRWLVAMSKNSKKRSSSAVQQPSVKVQLLAVHPELTVPVGSAWSIRQVFAHIEQEARRQYPTEQYVTGGVKFPDGRFEHESQLQSGLAFAQQQGKFCLLPSANNQPPLMDQLKQLLTDETSRLESSFDERLTTMKEKQDAVTAFTAKPVLLRLASDILSMTLSAVRPDLRRGATDNIWDQPLHRHQSFAGQLKKLCQQQRCPLNGSTIAVAFNGIRLNRNGELHQDSWESLLSSADQYQKLQCCVIGESLAEWIVFHAKDLKAVFDKHNTAGASAAGTQ